MRQYEIVNITKVEGSFNGNGCGLLLKKAFTAWNGNSEEVRTELVNFLIDAAGFRAVTGTRLSEVRRGNRLSIDGRLMATVSQNAQGQAVASMRFDVGASRYGDFQQGSGPVMGVKVPQRAAAPAQAPAAQTQAVTEDNVF